MNKFIIFLLTVFTTFTAHACATATTSNRLHFVAISNLLRDTLYHTNDKFLTDNNLPQGQTLWVNATCAAELQAIAENMCQKIQSGPGGSAGNTMVGLSNLGLNVGLIGSLADDALAQVYIQSLNEKSIQYRLTPAQDQNLGSGTCSVFVTTNAYGNVERTMITNLGVSGDIRLSSEHINWAANAQCLLIEGYAFEPEATYASICKAASMATDYGNYVALTLSADFCVKKHRTKINKFIDKYVGILLGNESEAMELTGTSDPLDAATAFKNKKLSGAVTCGSKGAYVFNESDIYFINPPAVAKVVDTTGAGDQFAAGFLYELFRSSSIINAGQMGAYCAGEVIKHWGAHPQESLKENIAKGRAWSIDFDIAQDNAAVEECEGEVYEDADCEDTDCGAEEEG